MIFAQQSYSGYGAMVMTKLQMNSSNFKNMQIGGFLMSTILSDNFAKHNTYLRFVNGITINNIFKFKTSPYENNFKFKTES